MENKFAQRLKELRNEGNISQEFLTYENISKKSISDYELGKTQPDFDRLIVIARYFGTTTDYLLGLTNFRYILNENNPESVQSRICGKLMAIDDIRFLQALKTIIDKVTV
jgi:transcriptional regulator with XRE-family HTH domain